MKVGEQLVKEEIGDNETVITNSAQTVKLDQAFKEHSVAEFFKKTSKCLDFMEKCEH